jgi:hypothetical protein
LDSVNPPPTEDDEDPAAFDQFLQSLSDSSFEYPARGQHGPDPESEPDPEEEEPEPEPDNPPTMPPTGTVRIGDRDVPLGEVQALYELGQMFREGKLTGSGAHPTPPEQTPGEETPPPPPPAVIPDFIDQDNPASMQLWEYLQTEKQSWQTELDRTRESATRAESALRERLAVENTQAAVTQFRQEYSHLSDDEMSTILSLSGPMVNHFVSQYQSPIEGLKRAFYVAALDNPTTRDAVLQTGAKTAQQKSRERKQKLGSISGSSTGSGSRQSQPRPVISNDRQATEEFAKGLADAYQANGRIN